MSITRNETVRCPCGAAVEVTVADSLNAGRHPHLRQMVLDRTLHTFSCGGCGEPLIIDKDLLFFDWDRKQIIGCYPESERPNERACGEALLHAYELTLGKDALPAVQAVSRDFLVRIVFGYEELREKIVADEAGLSDLALELLKVELMLAEPAFQRDGVITFYLEGVADDGNLVFVPSLPDQPRALNAVPFAVERALYEQLAAHADELYQLRPGIASGPHCSLLRLAHAPSPEPS